MIERAYRFGSHGGLSGVLCEPTGGAAPSAPAVLLFNVGLNHHVGPHRLNVELARHLAANGFASLRFDLSGLGDSEPRRDNRSDQERSIADIREAMDFLARRKNLQAFVVVALCSGVDPAHAVAVADARIKGAVFIDGYAYPTRGYYVRRTIERAGRFVSPAAHRSWWRRRVLPRLGLGGVPEIGERTEIFDRTFPPRTSFLADLDRMVRRRTALLFLYTRQWHVYNYREQFAAMIGTKRLPHGVEVDWLPDADHVFTSTAERWRLVRRVGDWMESQFEAMVAVPDSAVIAS